MKIKNTNLELISVKIPDNYRKEWNIHQNDFFHLYKNKKLVSNTLYRLGGLFNDKSWGVIHIIKNVESFYKNNITKNIKEKKHLASHFCIINAEGKELKVFKEFDNSYLIAPAIYICNKKYYNLFTHQPFVEDINKPSVDDTRRSSVESKTYLFIENKYDDNKKNRGVIQVNKLTGESKLIK